jgi:hypothetical protein
MNQYAELATLGAMTAVIARTVTQEQIFAGLRKKFSTTVLNYFLGCQYCFSFWVAATLVWVDYGQPTEFFQFVTRILVVVAVANAMLITYERATVGVKVQRTIDAFNLKQVELSETLIAGHRLNNAMASIQLESQQIQIESLRRLKQAADDQHAQQEIDLARNSAELAKANTWLKQGN